ncbi:MAG: hypothetical protein QXR14_02905 [Sulfolobales archaeon]
MVRNTRSFGVVLVVFIIAVLSLLPSPVWYVNAPLTINAQQAGDQNTSVASNDTANNATAITTNVTDTTTEATEPLVEEVISNITTVTVVSYITLPPVTRPPSSTEIASWISGGVITGILIGLSVGYAIFAKGVSIKRQQVGSKTGGKPGEKRKK